MEELSDEQLVERYRSGQGSADGALMLDELFRRHRAKVAAWCYRMAGEVDAAADLAQDVMLKAFQSLDSFRGNSRFTTWLYSIARNHCMDALRARALRPYETIDVELGEVADLHAEEVSTALERRESAAAVQRLMRECLDETEAKIMALHYVEELPLDAITRLMGLTNASGSKAYIVSARRKLARAIERWRRDRGSKGAYGT